MGSDHVLGYYSTWDSQLMRDSAARIEELEDNERAYEAALGQRTYNEVAGYIADLEAALKPFADIAQYVVETQRDARPLTFGMDNVIVQRLTIGHLRKARAAIQTPGAS
jgi:hypothetical protein